MTQKKRYLLIGAPNCGKSSLFNMLTGSNRPVGNRPGVTVDKSEATLAHQPSIILEDLPGIYYIDSQLENCSLDYQVTLQRLNHLASDDIIINVIDARFLRRQLYLSLQLIELQRPMMIVLTFASHSALAEALQKAVGVPVYRQEQLLHQFWEQLEYAIALPPHRPDLFSQKDLEQLRRPQKELLVCLEKILDELCCDKALLAEYEDKETVLATWRHHWIEKQTFTGTHRFFAATEIFDKIFLHKIFGVPIFFLLMYIVFAMTIQIGSLFNDFLQIPLESLVKIAIDHSAIPAVLLRLLEGLYLGVATVLSFVAPLSILYFSLGLLEQTGYMQRAAVVIDRFMQWMHLPGQSFIPFVVGFGCNVPGIMATRTLQDPIDRLQTILMSPFMSCSARLAIFTVFTKSFFEASQGALIIFMLYVLGIIVAICTGMMIRLTLSRQPSSPLVQEIVPYQWPNLTALLTASLRRTSDFVKNAAALIIPTTMIIHLYVVYGYKIDLSYFKILRVIFEPMGLGEAQWPAIVSLIAGLIAKEIIIGTLEGLHNSVILPELANTGQAVIVLSHTQGESLAGLFDNPHAAISYLIFVLLYFPCISVTSTIAQESRRFWAIFSIVWSTSIAYITAVLYYQYAAVNQSAVSLIGLTFLSVSYLYIITIILKRKLQQTAVIYPVHFRLKHS